MTHDVMRTKKAIDAFTLARARQVVNHGFTSAKDDRYTGGELSSAAACYAMPRENGSPVPRLWPWNREWWKPSKSNDDEGRKRDLEKAGALLIAEWERLDRLQERRAEEDVT